MGAKKTEGLNGKALIPRAVRPELQS